MAKVAKSSKCTVQLVAVYHGGEEAAVQKITIHAGWQEVHAELWKLIEEKQWQTGRLKRMSGGRVENGRPRKSRK